MLAAHPPRPALAPMFPVALVNPARPCPAHATTLAPIPNPTFSPPLHAIPDPVLDHSNAGLLLLLAMALGPRAEKRQKEMGQKLATWAHGCHPPATHILILDQL